VSSHFCWKTEPNEPFPRHREKKRVVEDCLVLSVKSVRQNSDYHTGSVQWRRGDEDLGTVRYEIKPWVRSLTHSPIAVIHSPAAMVAEWPTTVTKSRTRLGRIGFRGLRRHKSVVQSQTRQRLWDHDHHRICTGQHDRPGPLDPGDGPPGRRL
jgi:hypothetical protein